MYLYTMPPRFIPLPQTVWRPKLDRTPVTWPTFEVIAADEDTVTVRQVGNPLDVSFRKWNREEFLDLYEAVSHPGPVTKRGIRTRYEKMLEEDDI